MTAKRSTADSAVLVPVYRDTTGALRVVLIVRTEHGRHGGQVALPGGMRSGQDNDLVATALREAEEEVGLPRDAVEILTALPLVDTTTGYLITPFLAHVTAPPSEWRRQEREIAEVLVVPVADLGRADLRGEELWQLPGWTVQRRIRFIRIGAHKLWGATFRILDPLVPRLLAGEWPI
jgi:8-oxo-dGTP pyrophosphatase MutT (NUDIX family)